MIVACTQCQTRYQIPDDKLRRSGTKVLCQKCQTTFVVYPADATEIQHAVNQSHPMQPVRQNAPPFSPDKTQINVDMQRLAAAEAAAAASAASRSYESGAQDNDGGEIYIPRGMIEVMVPP